VAASATQANVALLKKRGAEFIGPEKAFWPAATKASDALAGGTNRPKSGLLAPVNEEAKTNPANVGAIQKLTRLLAAPVIEPSQRAAAFKRWKGTLSCRCAC